MLRLKRRQREIIVEKLPDLANMTAGALVVGQFIGERPFSFWLALGGFAAWSAFGLIALRLAGDDQ
jgi:hypothetical protein